MSKEIQCKCCKEYWWEMNIHKTSGLCPNCYDYVADLEAKLAESKKQCQQCKHLNKKIELNIKNKLISELAEKEKEIDNLYNRLNSKQKFYEMGLEKDYKEYLSRLNKIEKRQDQNKISFAVEQLEKVKENLLNFPAVTNEDIKILKKKQKEHFDKRLMDFCKHNLNFIDKQIKQLKEGK